MSRCPNLNRYERPPKKKAPFPAVAGNGAGHNSHANYTLSESLRSACAEVGIIFRDAPADGRWHAADIIDDPHGRGDGRIKLFPDGEGGIVCNWKGETKVFFADGSRTLTDAERADRDRKRQEAIRQASEEEARRKSEAAKRAAVLWTSATPAQADHAYLVKKGVGPVPTLREISSEGAAAILGYLPKSNGQPLFGRLLLVPVKVGDAISTMEIIDQNGRKSAIRGGAKAGGYWSAQPLPDGNGEGLTLLIGEGVATVLSAKEATEHLAIAALSCGNMGAIAKTMRERYPAARLAILADLGRGQEDAGEAARVVGAAVVAPDFAPDLIGRFQAAHGKTPTDLNDLHQLAGPDAVRAQIEAAISGKVLDIAKTSDPDPLEATGGAATDPAVATGSGEPAENWQAVVQHLAKLPPIEFDRTCKDHAKRLGCKVSTLKAEVRKAREPGGDTNAKGRRIELYIPEPWTDPVDGAAVLDEARNAIRRYMAIQEEHAIAAVLWAATVHVFDAFSHTPRLAVTAPDAECGKTLLLQLLAALVPRPQPVEIMKAAPFFRMAEEFRPCFLIDETDIFIKEDADLLAAINNGWEPHGGVLRCVGENFEVRSFSTHTPVAMGGIKLHKVLPATTLSRSIIITLERAMPGEIEEPYDARKHRDGLLELGRKLARWCLDHRDALYAADPSLPGGAFNRRADKWRPLFAIAELAGGDWPALTRKAYLSEEKEGSIKLSTALQLLADIQEVIKPTEHVISTEDLIDRLSNLDESSWQEYNFRERDNDRRKIQPRQVSGLLRDYRVKPANVRIGPTVPKGYRRIDLESAWTRYLPGAPPEKSATPLQTSSHAGSSDSVSATRGNDVADRKSLQAAASLGCSVVADKKPPLSGRREVSL